MCHLVGLAGTCIDDVFILGQLTAIRAQIRHATQVGIGNDLPDLGGERTLVRLDQLAIDVGARLGCAAGTEANRRREVLLHERNQLFDTEPSIRTDCKHRHELATRDRATQVLLELVVRQVALFEVVLHQRVVDFGLILLDHVVVFWRQGSFVVRDVMHCIEFAATLVRVGHRHNCVAKLRAK